MNLLRRRNSDQAPGEDSFLDIVANLVGVLIILVVVVGAHAGSKIRERAVSEVDRNELEKITRRFQLAAATALNWQRDNHDLERQIHIERQLTAERRAARDQLLVEIESVKRELSDRKSRLSDEHQTVFDQQDEFNRLRDELDELDRRYSALQSAHQKSNTIEHYPTPIAKTVFSDEVHFRLLAGQIVHVPLEELVELMRDEWRETAKKLDTADETIETVGPIENFRLQYRLAANHVKMHTPYGGLVQRTPEFKRFVLVPTREEIGQPLSEALADDSRFWQRINRLDPAKTTISLWVYPDSFSEFNQLKKWLYQRGFQTACWPLSTGNLISGGPSGYRSTAQ